MASTRQIVVEIGEKLVRGGFSGEVKPRFTLSHSIFSCDVPLRVYLNELFQKIFIQHLHVKAKQFNILLVEGLLLQRNVRDMLISILLKDFQVLAVSIQPDLLLGIASSGSSSGTILKIGHNECQSMCFVDGRPLLQTLQETEVGAAYAEASFRRGLEAVLETNIAEFAAAEVFRSAVKSAEFDSTGMEEECPDMEVLPIDGVSKSAFTLPGKYRSSCLQGLITGCTADGECVDEKGGAAGILLESLRACNHDVRLRAAQHLVIIGEGAVIPGICESICHHATRLSALPEYASVLEKVVQKLPDQRFSLVPTVFERSTLAWVGGSLFASIKETKSSFVTLQDLLQRDRSTAPDSTTNKSTTSTATTVPVSTTGVMALPDNFLLTAPDWQSLDRQDWVFCKPSHSNMM